MGGRGGFRPCQLLGWWGLLSLPTERLLCVHPVRTMGSTARKKRLIFQLLDKHDRHPLGDAKRRARHQAQDR